MDLWVIRKLHVLTLSGPAIQAPAQQPPVHPHDRPLLRPLATLGKPKVSETSVSFLRRTEYISSVQASRKNESSVFMKPGTGLPQRRPEKRKASAAEPELDKDSPAYIKRKIERGFEHAAASLRDRSRIKHPSKRNVRLVDAYPMLPDLDAFPDSGAYVTVKFATNPVAASNVYDKRLLTGMFRPIARTQKEEEAFNAGMAAYAADPEHATKPFSVSNWNYYLPDSAESASNFLQKYDVADPHRDDEALYTAISGDADATPCFRFQRVRAYETAEEMELDHATKYDREVLLSFVEDAKSKSVQPQSGSGGKAVFYYPVMQRSLIRNQRTKNIARNTAGVVEPEVDSIALFEVTVQDPSEAMTAQMREFAERPLEFPEQQAEDDDEAGNGHGGEEEEDRAERNGDSPMRNGNRHASDDDDQLDERDAEGDDE
jgi:RNA polymerase II-associated factor 1